MKEAFRIIPVAPEDRLLLVTQWKGNNYIDKVLPFGLQSIPILFTAVADAIEWIIRHHGVKYVYHYVDDFILVGRHESKECASALVTTLRICSILGVPIKLTKCEGPTTTLTILGIEVSTCNMQLRLPTEKLRSINQAVRKWRG